VFISGEVLAIICSCAEGVRQPTKGFGAPACSSLDATAVFASTRIDFDTVADFDEGRD
jgi:hypothetical protein